RAAAGRRNHRHRDGAPDGRGPSPAARGREPHRRRPPQWNQENKLKRLLSAACCLLSLSATAETLTLQQALARALQVNNTIERARAEINVVDQSRKQLLSAVMPHITTTGSTTRNSEEVAFGSGEDARTVLPRNDWNYRVVLSQPIYAGRREFRAYSQAKLGVENAREAERGTEDAVLLRVAS